MTQRNTDTLRDAMFANIEGLKTGAIKPDVAKASASCAMAICKTVELDIKATELLKKATIEPLQLTTEPKPVVIERTLPDHVPSGISLGTLIGPSPLDDEEIRESIEKGNKIGLSRDVIAKRLRIDEVYVSLHLNSIVVDSGANS